MSGVAPPPPRPSVGSAPFWEACARGEFQLQRCARCGEAFFPPSRACPRCWSRDVRWVAASGRGTIHSFVVFRRPYHPAYRDALPYTVAVVALEEGPRFLTRLVGVAPEAVRCGIPVEVAFTDVAGVRMPFFRPRG